MGYSADVQKLVSLVKDSNHFYVLTGAGISTDSGIADFRSPGTGLWEKMDPIETASVQTLFTNPKLFFEVGFSFFADIMNAVPNDGHYALARMEEMGYLKGIITQNIDGLHLKAGSKNIWEAHGHFRTCSCTQCRTEYPMVELTEQVRKKQIPPICQRCFGMLRPNVVLFGDNMSSAFFEAEKHLKAGCELLLIVGSSLEVYPVAYLPRLAEKYAIINNQPTDFDDGAELVIHEKCSKVLTDMVQLLELS